MWLLGPGKQLLQGCNLCDMCKFSFYSLSTIGKEKKKKKKKQPTKSMFFFLIILYCHVI